MSVKCTLAMLLFCVAETTYAQVSITGAAASPGGVAVVPVSFSAGGVPISALQFDLTYPTSLTLSVLPGDVVRGAMASLQVADVGASRKRFLISGWNETALTTGTLVTLLISVRGNAAQGTVALSFNNVVASAPDASVVSLGSQDGTVDVRPGVPLTLGTSGVLNAASLLPGPIAPGEVVTLLGNSFRMGDSRRVSDTTVLVNGTPAPVLYASTNQVNVIIPQSTTPAVPAVLSVLYLNQSMATVSVPVTDVAPGIFTQVSTGVGTGAILNQDYSLNSESQPADRGSSVMIFATGSGVMNPPLADGQITPSTTNSSPIVPVSVQIGGIDAPVSYAGAAPSLIAGILQVNCQVPMEVMPGPAVPVILQIGTGASQTGVTMAIK